MRSKTDGSIWDRIEQETSVLALRTRTCFYSSTFVRDIKITDLFATDHHKPLVF
jgi:hypothetical protein